MKPRPHLRNKLVEHAPPNLVGGVRFQIWPYRKLEKRYLRPVQPRAQRPWVGAREQFTRSAAIVSPLVQHSLRK